MSNFRTRILGLGVFALAFAGLSYGQAITCVTGAQTNPTLRAEGQTELLGQMTVTCTNTVGGVTGPTGGTVYIQTSLPITSKTWTTSGVVTNEATIQASSAVAGSLCFANPAATPPVVPPAACTVQGAVSGSQVSFQLPAGALAGAGDTKLVISNIRVNASQGGAPQVTESGILSYTINSNPPTSSNTAIAASAQGAGFILKTLGPAVIAGPGANNTPALFNTCTNYGSSITAAPTMATLQFNELVSGAFLTQAGEQGQYVSGTNIGTAQSGDIVNITLTNVPSSATIWVPQTISTGGTTLTVANSTAPTSGPYSTAATTPLAAAPYVSFTPSSNVVTIPYTVTNSVVSGPTTFTVDVRMALAANSAAAQGAITIAVAYAPAAAALTGPATSVPTFLAGTPTTVNGSAITICQTSLLYPFVTNQLGFDTGLVIANTSTDNLGLAGASIASKQAGTCNLSFYGAGAPTPATGVADPGGNLASGTTHAFLLSAVAPGFQGYMIATCPFQFAHGFGFLAYNLTQNNGAVEGYIAEVLTRANLFAAASTGQENVTF